MPKILSNCKRNRYLIDVVITNFEKSGFEIKNSIACKALIDTGVSTSVVSTSILEKLGIEPNGFTHVATASNNYEKALTYETVFHFPAYHTVDFTGNTIDSVRPDIFITKWTNVNGNNIIQNNGLDAIIGLDILNDSHTTIIGGKMILSF